MTPQEQTVLVGVTGGIGAYKSCELVRLLQKRGVRVKVVMTDAATKFVTPLTFRTLTGEPVAVTLWGDEPGSKVHHISLAQEADLLVIVPCTANVIAKLAHGRADDLLTTTVLATEAPIVIAPAMNTHMWRKEVTQRNVAELVARGMLFVAPGTGELACGEVGEGRLADVSLIADTVIEQLRRMRDLEGRRLIVTAGGTQEPIDPVRFFGNRSSGKTGYAIAAEAARRGASVSLITAPSSLPDPFGCEVVRVHTALQMRAAVGARMPGTDALVMAAAVADFRPATVAVHKIKKTGEPAAIELVRNPDILAELGQAAHTALLIGFAAETEHVVDNARAKLESKRVDLIVANDVSDPALGFGTDDNHVWFVTRSAAEDVPQASKHVIASELLNRISGMFASKKGS